MPNYDDPEVTLAFLDVTAQIRLRLSEMAHETDEGTDPKAKL
jgi:hypothetical protein